MNAIASVIRPAAVRRATTCRASEKTSRPLRASVNSFQPGAPASSLHPRPATRTTWRSLSRSTSESGISTIWKPRERKPSRTLDRTRDHRLGPEILWTLDGSRNLASRRTEQPAPHAYIAFSSRNGEKVPSVRRGGRRVITSHPTQKGEPLGPARVTDGEDDNDDGAGGGWASFGPGC